MENKKNVCVICGREFEGFGNNPEPVTSLEKGDCCDKCNAEIVIPLRICKSEISSLIRENNDIKQLGYIRTLLKEFRGNNDATARK